MSLIELFNTYTLYVLTDKNGFIISIKDSENHQYVPLFTDAKQYSAWKDEFIPKTANLKIILKMFHTLHYLDGVIVDPMKMNPTIFSKEEVLNILEQSTYFPKNSILQVQAPIEIPMELHALLINFFKENPSVQDAYLVKVINMGAKENYLVVLDMDPFDEKFCYRISLDAIQILHKDEQIGFIPADSELGEEITKITEPFYSKEISLLN